MEGNRPRGRQKNVTGKGKAVKRRGSGLGTGPVGSTNQESESRKRSTGSGTTRSGSSSGLGKIIIILLIVLLGGGGGLGSLLSGGGLGDILGSLGSSLLGGSQSSNGSGVIEALIGSLGGGSISSGWDNGNNTGKLDSTVASGTRAKYTDVKGNGKDEITIMVYMCGTDLESKYKMASSDLQEMTDATISDKINLIVYTGGCNNWQKSSISNKTNQIWQIKKGKMVCLEKNLGSKAMTDSDTLVSFIKWCKEEFPANRNALIFWDHGGGSVSGFGYDEKFSSNGSMNLAEIDYALSQGGVKFDFVGFDACLMATTENALMLAKHADYMIASEETEPGIGWYYTDWLTELSKNTSMSTPKIGKLIIDDFIETCDSKCAGQSTTLSIIDLAEAEATIPAALAAFSKDTYKLIENKEYAKVSNARSDAREFGATSKIDQVDLVHLAKNMNTKEGEALAQALLGAVKYNRTSSNMTNSYGLSIYFPFRKASMVDTAVNTYENIGMDDEYARCIQAFASMEVSGQAASGGTASPLPSLLDLLGQVTGGSSGNGSDALGQLLGNFLGGDVSSITDLLGCTTNFLSGRALDEEEMVEYISENSFDGTLLYWQATESGEAIILPEEQWKLVQTLHANMFYDDGEGFIDLGLDTVYDFDEKGNLLAPKELTWLAVNDQPVAYYHESTVDDGENYSITGRIPVLYNGERAELIVEFSDEIPSGRVVGVRRVYTDGETMTVAKTMDKVSDGDVIDFVCDYYSYDGDYLDSYMLGEQLTVNGELVISDVYVTDADAAKFTYIFTDIYNQKYWSNPVK